VSSGKKISKPKKNEVQVNLTDFKEGDSTFWIAKQETRGGIPNGLGEETGSGDVFLLRNTKKF